MLKVFIKACLCSVLITTLLSACSSENERWSEDAAQINAIHDAMQGITDIIVHDIFSPPQASRIYAYSSVAAYEAAHHANPAYKSLVGQLNQLESLPQPDAGADYSFDLAATVALLKVGKQLTFSEDKADMLRDTILQRFQAVRMPADVYERSVAYGEEVAEAVIAWSTGDQYLQTRTFPKFSINNQEGRWRPTPPDFMDGIEPHWSKIRPLVLDSATQCKPLSPPPYDMTEGSRFYEDVMEVYHALDSDEKERREIAAFWDCNPYVSHHQGHVMFATKKISPGGHWMGIAKTVAEKEGLNTIASAEVYSRVSIALFDGFISCWDEKYRSNVIRPETVINALIDPEWLPILQTPPFPEYTSGHSVISRAAATALTTLFGANYAYVDSVEVSYGLPPRSYTSFYQASEEAAISRLYGGIHYMPAITEGVKQGQIVGDLVVARLKTSSSGASKTLSEVAK